MRMIRLVVVDVDGVLSPDLGQALPLLRSLVHKPYY
jgi:hypothetical protein